MIFLALLKSDSLANFCASNSDLNELCSPAEADPQHQLCQPALGCTKDPRRAAQAWHRYRMVSPGVHSGEHAVALQIDDLPGLRDRKGNRVIPVVMRVGPNEPVLFRAVGEVLLDDPRGLVLPLRSVRGSAGCGSPGIRFAGVFGSSDSPAARPPVMRATQL